MKIKINKSEKKTETYKVGDWIILDGFTQSVCILAQVDSSIVSIISISENDANRQNDCKIKVNDIRNITQSEMNTICDGKGFRKVEASLTITD